MKKFELYAATAPVPIAACPAPAHQTARECAADQTYIYDDIVVPAQRPSARLQDVPVAVSAFSAAALARQQLAPRHHRIAAAVHF